jgi:hypothetical protein
VSPEGEASNVSARDPEQLMARYQNGDAAAAKSLIDLLSVQLHYFFRAKWEAAPRRMTCCRTRGSEFTGCAIHIGRGNLCCPGCTRSPGASA